jgi:hypothetical protein
MSIKETYNGHEIIALAVQLADSEEWQPRFIVVESNEDPAMITPRTIDRSFPTEQEAEREALLFAKRWIDDGKPPI